MKKYLLSSLLGVFVLFSAFVSAESFTFIGDWWTAWEYSPSSFTTDWWLLNYTSFVPNYDCFLNIGWDCQFYVNNDWIVDTSSSCIGFNLPAWTYNVNWGPWNSCNSFSITVWNSWDSSWTLLPWWITTLDWLISSLKSVLYEFIPYLVYIGLGVLGAIIWFIAIKRLINRIRVKVLWTFSGGRRRN